MARGQQKRWLTAVGLLGAVVLLIGISLVVIANREQEPPQQPEIPALHLEDLRLEKPLDMQAFWREHGFIPVSREVQETLRHDWAAEQWVHWTQRTSDWNLVPYRPDANFQDAMGKLVTQLVSGGLTIQMDQRGERVSVSIFEAMPFVQTRMELEVWTFQRQTPAVYDPDAVGGRLAIVIDDWGYTSSAMDPLLRFPFPLTLAVLPHLPQSRTTFEEGTSFAHEVILHQPMEAQNPEMDPGEGAIYSGMDADEMIAHLEANMVSVGAVVGVNNHMGSKVTEDPVAMKHILEYLQEEGLFFLDSLTTHNTVSPTVAQEVGIPYAVNKTFLDNLNETEAVMEQIRHALRMAQEPSDIIAIGHVRQRTAEALWAMIPELIAAGVELVPVSELLFIPGSETAPELLESF